MQIPEESSFCLFVPDIAQVNNTWSVLRKAMTNLASVLKSRDIALLTKSI